MGGRRCNSRFAQILGRFFDGNVIRRRNREGDGGRAERRGATTRPAPQWQRSDQPNIRRGCAPPALQRPESKRDKRLPWKQSAGRLPAQLRVDANLSSSSLCLSHWRSEVRRWGSLGPVRSTRRRPFGPRTWSGATGQRSVSGGASTLREGSRLRPFDARFLGRPLGIGHKTRKRRPWNRPRR
jgi:hypothetical protein